MFPWRTYSGRRSLPCFKWKIKRGNMKKNFKIMEPFGSTKDSLKWKMVLQIIIILTHQKKSGSFKNCSRKSKMVILWHRCDYPYFKKCITMLASCSQASCIHIIFSKCLVDTTWMQLHTRWYSNSMSIVWHGQHRHLDPKNPWSAWKIAKAMKFVVCSPH